MDNKAKDNGHRSCATAVLFKCFWRTQVAINAYRKSAKPRALKNVNVNSLPVIYRSQNKTWMYSNILRTDFVPAVKTISMKRTFRKKPFY